MKFLSLFVLSLAVLTNVSGYPQKGTQRGTVDTPKAGPDLRNIQINYDGSDMLMEETEVTTKLSDPNIEEPHQDSQTFFPSFSSFNIQPLGHSRPLYYQPDAAYSHRPTAYQQHVGYDSNTRFSGYKGDEYEERADANSILGSGNFGVIKGGTFYNENDDDQYGRYGDNYNNYYRNGHGRPSLHYSSSNRRPQQFENFRDFADINTPSYSEIVVVYANKNETHKEEARAKQPKNIIESLAMLDLEKDISTEALDSPKAIPTKKLSKSKRKLELVLPEKKTTIISKSTQKDLYEPLLALS